MKIFQGDLLDLAEQGAFDVMVHGCNCFCTMGAGIARQIRARFPEAYKADLATTKGDGGKLGTISVAACRRGDHVLIVVNAYTQFNWRGAGIKVDYQAVEQCMRLVAERYPDKRIGYPRIGAGLAGGDWTQIAEFIEEELYGLDHTLVEYLPTP